VTSSETSLHENLRGAPLLVATGLFDRELYEAQVGQTFPDDVAAAWHYLRSGRAEELLPHPLVDPLLLPARVRTALKKASVRIVVDHFAAEGLLDGLSVDPALPEARRRLLELFRRPVQPVEEPVVDWDALGSGLWARVPGRVSVVIPTWNDCVMTTRAVARVLEHSGATDVEVVVVDNGSRRDLGEALVDEFATEPRVRIEPMPRNLNFALGSNVGFARSSGEFTVFLNNDTEVHPNWLAPLIRRLDDPSLMGVQPLLLYPDGTIQTAGTVFPLADSLPCHFLVGEAAALGRRAGVRPFHAVTAAALAMRAADVVRLRGFDTVFVNGMEDVDLCLRAADTASFVVEPDSVVTHHESKTPGRSAQINPNRATFMSHWRGRLPAAEPGRWTDLGLKLERIDLDGGEIPAPRPVVRHLD